MKLIDHQRVEWCWFYSGWLHGPLWTASDSVLHSLSLMLLFATQLVTLGMASYLTYSSCISTNRAPPVRFDSVPIECERNSSFSKHVLAAVTSIRMGGVLAVQPSHHMYVHSISANAKKHFKD